MKFMVILGMTSNTNNNNDYNNFIDVTNFLLTFGFEASYYYTIKNAYKENQIVRSDYIGCCNGKSKTVDILENKKIEIIKIDSQLYFN